MGTFRAAESWVGPTGTTQRPRFGSSRAAEDLTLSSRYECKYLVHPDLVPLLRQQIEPFVRPDPYAARSPGYRYGICSLYLDSPELSLYQQTVAGERDRYKLRIRTYSDDPTHPIFLEVKRRKNNIVLKRRAKIDRELGLRMVDGEPVDLESLPAELRADALYFNHHTVRCSARPVVRVRYSREAYESRAGDPVRLTLDTDLSHAVTLASELSHGSGRWVTTPVQGVILELKFSDNYPTWMNDLVQLLGVTQRPVPKYVMSIDHMMAEGRESVLSLAGFQLPPRQS